MVLGSLPLKQSAFSIQSFLVFKAYIMPVQNGLGFIIIISVERRDSGAFGKFVGHTSV
jgi:hypothetical protein